MNVKEFENEYLYEIKKEETNSDEIIKISDNIPSETESSNESNSNPNVELNDKIINSQMDDKKENNETLLKKNLNALNIFSNNNATEIPEINDIYSSKEDIEIDFKENKKYKNYIYIKEKDICKCIRHKKGFINYCIDCKFDLCIDCLNMKSDVNSNNIINNKIHENHSKISLIEIQDKFDEIDKLI